MCVRDKVSVKANTLSGVIAISNVRIFVTLDEKNNLNVSFYNFRDSSILTSNALFGVD